MGSTNYASKSKVGGYRAKSGSSVGSDKEINGKLKRAKIRRPGKMNEYGLKRIPDYTELAYKEAVSKLRYFLSGNYAPSLRSYGSPASIKNLDESDGDTADKKYTSYGQLAEYKARPRLTTKYTTLYADSLKNYNQPNLTVTPPAAPATNDLTGGTNPDVINFIQKQEEYIEQLERESQYCRDELNNLLGKVKEVISENEHLHEAQKNKLISRMFHTYNYAGSETDDVDDQGDSTGLDSDCKVTPSKAKRPAKTRSSKLEGPNIVFESRIAELEAQLAQSKIDLKKIQEENNENKRKLANGLVDSTCLDGFKRQIDNLQRDKNSLESQVSKLKMSLEQKDGDLDVKYKRSVDGIEQQLRDERNNLESEVRRLKEDLSNERSKIRELAGEGARRAIQERSAAEQRYNAHFDELSHDLAAQYDCVAKLQLDLERQRREENDLKRELSLKTAAVEELKMELKNKSSNLQADLAQAYAEKASLEEELASARLALERVQRQSKHEVNRLNSEIQSLRQRLDRADADLVHSRRENLRLSEQISTLEKELNMKTLTPLSPEKTKKEKELSSVLESMENKHAETVAELESMIHSQNTLMEKLTGECRLLTDKLDDNNRRHKAQSRSRTDEPIRPQCDETKRRERRKSTSRRSGKESGLSNSQPPIVVGPLTTHQDLTNVQQYNLPLMIQQPFLHEKKEPIKVDISVKLMPRPKKDKKRRSVQVEEVNEVVGNTICMEILNGDVSIVKESVELSKDGTKSVELEQKADTIICSEDTPDIEVEKELKHDTNLTNLESDVIMTEVDQNTSEADIKVETGDIVSESVAAATVVANEVVGDDAVADKDIADDVIADDPVADNVITNEGITANEEDKELEDEAIVTDIQENVADSTNIESEEVNNENVE